MNNQFIDIMEMMELVHLKDRKHFRENYITPAIADGAIERKHPNLPKHPKQQYHLTGKALEWKRNQK